MLLIDILQAIILGIIQGITEWLPISSSGHLILANEFLNINVSEEFLNMFFVVIQLSSIFAVILLYFRKLNPWDSRKNEQQKQQTFSIWLKVLIGILPAGIIGVLFDDYIEQLFFNNSLIVAVALIVYGIIFIVVENKPIQYKISSFDDMSLMDALKIGLFQVLSLIPGTSRSGSTIIGATLIKTKREIAAEFSFFMSIPIMMGASGIKLLKYVLKVGLTFTGTELMFLIVGSLVSFLVSVWAIKFLMNYIRNNSFKVFGYYRIALGIIIIVYFFLIK